MERISRVWEIELQTVLEITKLGHRRRILRSVIERYNSASAAPKAASSPEHSNVNDGITNLVSPHKYSFLYKSNFCSISICNPWCRKRISCN